MSPARPAPHSVYVRRRLVALGVIAAVVTLLVWRAAALLSGSGNSTTADGATSAGGARGRITLLPRGGRTIFPAQRVVAFYGNPQARELGTLGIGSPSQALARLQRQARPYARKSRPVLPALELVSTVAASAPGDDGLYRLHAPAAVIDRYLRAARRAMALLVLDVQPGRGDFLSEVRRLRRWLIQPDVGLALDPEWHVGPGELPGRTIGSVGADEVNDVSAYLADIVLRFDLPEKLFVLHQFTHDMIRDKPRVRRRPGLATTVNVDGFGARSIKIAKYRAFTAERPRFHDGLKLFYEEDTNLLSPGAVMDLQPRPDLIVYE
jgi:hypothetical protein